MFDKMVTAIKRVYCLYRVSTLGQVEKDDIPMQKQFWVPPSGHKNIGQANRACPIIGFGHAGAFSAMRPVT